LAKKIQCEHSVCLRSSTLASLPGLNQAAIHQSQQRPKTFLKQTGFGTSPRRSPQLRSTLECRQPSASLRVIYIPFLVRRDHRCCGSTLKVIMETQSNDKTGEPDSYWRRR